MNARNGSLALALGMAAALCGACSKREAPAQIAAQSAALVFAEDTQQVERAPIELTASDGSGLLLVSLEARTVVDDPLAFTELHLVFHNPEPRRREGRFSMQLPEAAAISRFAMRVGDELQEGEVVERRHAQQAYEDFLHRKQDPALLEHAAGNEFSARVFPIEPNADKEIVVAYSEELSTRGQPYRLPLSGLSRLARLKVDVLLGSSSATGLESSSERGAKLQHLSLEKQDFAPSADLLLRLPERATFALRSGDLAVLRVRPGGDVERAPVEALTVLFDTSASRALGFAAQIERLGSLLTELVRQQGKDFELRLVAFDQDSEEIYSGSAQALSLRDKGRLLARDALGATDLHQALTALSEKPAAYARLVVVTDGLLTAGEDDVTRLREAIARLAAHGLTRLDVVAEGGVRDSAVLASLTRAGLKQTGAVLDSALGPAELAKRLLLSVREQVEVSVPGAHWVHPKRLESVQPGDERLVFVELPAKAELKVGLGGANPKALSVLEAPRPLLERAWARAKIEALTEELRAAGQRPDSEREALEREIVKLSTQHRVLSDLTALLVLENEDDYRRFAIERSALSSILQVGEEGLELVDRNELPRAVARDDKPPPGFDEEQGPQPGSPEPEAPFDRAAAAPREIAVEASRGAAPAQAERRPAAPAPSAKAEAKAKASADDFARPAKVAREEAWEPAPAASASAAPAPAASAPAALAPAVPRTRASSAGSASLGEGVASAAGASGAGNLGSLGAVQIAAPVALEARASVVVHTVAGLSQAEASAVLRAGLTARARACYQRAAQRSGERERVFLDISISDRGSVSDVYVTSGAVADAGVKSCLLASVRALQFPKPETGSANLEAGVELSMVSAGAPSAVAAPSMSTSRPARPRSVTVPTPQIDDAYSGALAAVFSALRAADGASALAQARAAHERDPADVIGLIALGEALEAQHELARAARVYGSLIDLFPARADLRRMAGERLERLGAAGLSLAVDTYRKALAQRPDHPSGHRLLAFAQLKQGAPAAAFQTLLAAHTRGFSSERFPAVDRILGEDLGLVGAAWLRSAPSEEANVRALLATRQLTLAQKPSLRFVLSWETDANDVDFHIFDGRGGHASYMRPKLASGGALYADITTGYGPECFNIDGAARAYPYVLQAHYFARGPMGYGMGKLEVVEHDGKGVLTFAEHPFVIMKDKAFLELARLAGPLR